MSNESVWCEEISFPGLLANVACIDKFKLVSSGQVVNHKGIISFSSKFRSYSVQWADKGGLRHHPSFIPKLPNLPMVALQS